mgnify:CR=1 FL=1|tara:strand:+ start:1442 stop:1810 length:369 start_codon:yes stop_codon:yes gene_type:complete
MATGFAADQPSPHVDNVPAFFVGNSVNSAVVTTTFSNMTKQVTITNTGSILNVGVSAAGLGGTAYIRMMANTALTLDMQTKQIVVKEETGSATATFSICAVLSRHEAQNFDALTTANGFEKV